VDRVVPGVDADVVLGDSTGGARQLVEHLLSLGHRRIAMVTESGSVSTARDRRKGYEAALKDYGIPLDKKLVIPGDYSFDDGFRGARKLLALKNPPTAIFGSNDEIAAGVLAAAKAANLSVPYDLSIAGFEDSPFSRQCWPALTTAAQATGDIARRATERLIGELKHGRHAEHSIANVGFSPTLVIRGSTGPVRPSMAQTKP